VEAKKIARTAVLEYLSQFDQTKSDEKQLVDNIMLFIGRPGRTISARGPVMSPTGALRDMLIAAGTKGVAEIEIYKAFKIGRPEMTIKCRVLVQRAKTPADRVWVTFDAATETYKVAGHGPSAPKGWAGYVPGEEL
jgi:hypothetical protein